MLFREFEQEIALFRQNIQQQQNAIYEQQRQVATARREVQEQEANNWREKSLITAQQATIENQLAVIRKENESLAERERKARLLEDQRRRNRFVIDPMKYPRSLKFVATGRYRLHISRTPSPS